ncbi:hypothetical protein Dimus_030803 [Dionaea muscipula]
MSKASLILMLLVATICTFLDSATALIHVVGGSNGWEIPPNNTFYAEWAKPRTFGLGDRLVFPYRTGAHNVLQVLEKDFETCGNDNVINHYFRGPTIIQLNTTGEYYFYSGIGTHCEAGQKLHITVVNGPGSSGKFFHSTSEEMALAPAPAPTLSDTSSAGEVRVLGKICFALSFLPWLFM